MCRSSNAPASCSSAKPPSPLARPNGNLISRPHSRESSAAQRNKSQHCIRRMRPLPRATPPIPIGRLRGPFVGRRIGRIGPFKENERRARQNEACRNARPKPATAAETYKGECEIGGNPCEDDGAEERPTAINR